MDRTRPSMDEDQVQQRVAQLLNELRNTLLGVQILLAGLVSVPFTQRFASSDAVEHRAYLVAVLAAALASVCLITPAQYHRLARRYAPSQSVMRVGAVFGTLGAGFLTVAISSVVFLVTRATRPGVVPAVGATVVGTLAVVLWFALPLLARRGSGGGAEER